jgi:hypothetical protein
MANKETESQPRPATQIFDCDLIPLPPGTKNRARLPRGLEPEPLPARAWWLLGGTALVALLVGLVVGRFLLP